jgi:predicted PurR-regulated permease PerM
MPHGPSIGGRVESERSIPRTLTFLLTLAVLLYLIEKIGQALLSLSTVWLMLAVAWLLAFTLRPLVKWIGRQSAPAPVLEWVRKRAGDKWARRLEYPSRGFSIFVVYLGLVTVIAIIVLAFVPLVVEQIRQLVDTIQQQANKLPAGIQRVTEFMTSAREFLITQLHINPDSIPLPTTQDLVTQFAGIGTSLIQFGLGLLAGIAAVLGQFLLVVFLSVLVMIDGGRLVEQVTRVIPKRYENEMQHALDTIDRAFGGFLRGTLLQGVIYGIGVIVLMTMFGLGSAVATGTITGVLMLIPILGGPIGLIVPLLVGLLQSSPNTLWLIGALIIFQIILFNFIAPRLLSHALRMPSLLVIVSLLIGVQLIGVWGFVFAVPIAAVIYSIGLVILEQAKRAQDRHDEINAQEKALE